MKNGLIYTVTLCLLLSIFPANTYAEQKLLGDEGDGSRSVPIHLIPLFDEEALQLDRKSQPILPDDKQFMPFSTRQTCGSCHSYDTINKGWHFNAVDGNVPTGRSGEPWIFVDVQTATQIPLSYRSWPGTFRPDEIGLTCWQFTRLFGRQMPGGGSGELESDNPDEIVRQPVSGKLEINCLSCHNASPKQNQSEYARQIALQNFRWAPTASCGFASVQGVAAEQSDFYDPLTSEAITVTYRPNIFDSKNNVFFDVVRKVRAERCYFCHSNIDLDKNSGQKWAADTDVHLSAGLTCVDCHRQGLSHNTIRGYEGEASDSNNTLAAASSCKGCHLGELSSSMPAEGRLGASVPTHPGIPPVHFDKLACTACHSGPWPAQQTHRIKTSMAHGLGVINVNKSYEALPHIAWPVFAKQADGKIAPHKLLWPAFWGSLKDDKVVPINTEIVKQTAGEIIAQANSLQFGNWPKLANELIAKVLTAFTSQELNGGKPVYICGGRLYKLDNSGKLIDENHSAAQPYLWPFAHDVRPAAQSLGARQCQDCHSTDASFFFADVEADTPLASEKGAVKKMIEFQGLNPVYTKLFAFSFIFRPVLMVVVICSSAILAAVLILYAFQGLACILNLLSGEKR